MSKFNRLVKKFTAESFNNILQIDAAIEQLTEISDALKEGLTHYSDHEKLNNWNEMWYRNARESYEEKLEKVDGIILQLRGRHASLSANATAPKV